MRTLHATTVVLTTLLLAACGEQEGTSANEALVCEDPEFVEGIDPDWAPCGCGEGLWLDACEAAGNRCEFNFDADSQIIGGTCAPSFCQQDSDCPSFKDVAARCDVDTGYCFLPCDTGVCPQGFWCTTWYELSDTALCIHNSSPKESS